MTGSGHFHSLRSQLTGWSRQWEPTLEFTVTLASLLNEGPSLNISAVVPPTDLPWKCHTCKLALARNCHQTAVTVQVHISLQIGIALHPHAWFEIVESFVVHLYLATSFIHRCIRSIWTEGKVELIHFRPMAKITSLMEIVSLFLEKDVRCNAHAAGFGAKWYPPLEYHALKQYLQSHNH